MVIQGSLLHLSLRSPDISPARSMTIKLAVSLGGPKKQQRTEEIKFGFKTPSQLVPMLPYFDIYIYIYIYTYIYIYIYLHYFAAFFPGQIPSSFGNGHHHSALIGPGFETYLPSWDGLNFVKRDLNHQSFCGPIKVYIPH